MNPPNVPALRRADQPFHVMAKPIGPKCNLDCAYCFYLEKEALYGDGEKYRMKEDLLEKFVRDTIAAQPGNPITFAWQGGEPTLCGLPFFERMVELQRQHGDGRQIENAFQTNGTLIDDEWAAFFKREGFLVGVSIDGPRELHDQYRTHRNGKGTFDEVLRGIEFLRRHRVEFNTLTCVNAFNASHGEAVYRFLKRIGSRYLQFIPIVERLPDAAARQRGLSLATPPRWTEEDEDFTAPVTEWSVQPKTYGRFLWSVFKRWVQTDVGRVFIQFFDVALGKWARVPGGLCVFDETCGRALALEHDGTLYSCDHFVYPEFALGNIQETPIAELVESEFQKKFGEQKSRLPAFCLSCDYRFACNGGCPKQRFLETPDGEGGLNYLCSGYRFIFGKMDPYLRCMADLYAAGQPPSRVMEMIRQRRLPKPS